MSLDEASLEELSFEEDDLLLWCFLERFESFFFLLSFTLDFVISEMLSCEW